MKCLMAFCDGTDSISNQIYSSESYYEHTRKEKRERETKKIKILQFTAKKKTCKPKETLSYAKPFQ